MLLASFFYRCFSTDLRKCEKCRYLKRTISKYNCLREVRMKLPLCFIKHHSVNVWGAEAFISFGLYEVERSFSRSGQFNPGERATSNRWIGNYTWLIACVMAVEKRRVSHFVLAVVMIYRDEFKRKGNLGLENGPWYGEIAEYFQQTNKSLVSLDVTSCSLV